MDEISMKYFLEKLHGNIMIDFNTYNCLIINNGI